jgi:hypothetical protein
MIDGIPAGLKKSLAIFFDVRAEKLLTAYRLVGMVGVNW